MGQPDSVERRLTKNPKLGVLGWGLAGGFIMGTGTPGATLGTIGVALFFLGMVKSLVEALYPLALLLLLVSALSIYGGYTRYSRAYDRELGELEEKHRGESV
jgi:hypothetical protein